MTNKYLKCSHISERKFRHIIHCFSLDIEASKIAELTGISRNSINRIVNAVRMRMAAMADIDSPLGSGEVEIDESYFGARRVRGVRGRGARGKTIVFGIIHRGGKVYTQIVRNCSASELISIITEKVPKNSVLYTDSFKSYDGLVNFGYRKHHRIKHGENEFAIKRNHINGIENFWSISKTRLVKFRGISKNTFNLHLKECQFRFNHRNQNLAKILLKMFRKSPLKLS